MAILKDTLINGACRVIGDAYFNSIIHASGNTSIGGTFGVTGATTLSSTLSVTGATTLSSTLSVSGTATHDSYLDMKNGCDIRCYDSGGSSVHSAMVLDGSNTFAVGYGMNNYSTKLYGSTIYLLTGTSRGTAMTLTTSGNVGIGTTSPATKLHVRSDQTYSGDAYAIATFENHGFTNDTFCWGTNIHVPYLASGNNVIYIAGKANSLYNKAYFGYHHVSDGSSSNYATIGLYGADNLVNITGSGNVGIGTPSPTVKLQVHGQIFGYNYSQTNGSNQPAFIFDKPGSHYTGIGCHGVNDTIWFGAVSNGDWVDSYYQKWHFNGALSVAGTFASSYGATTGSSVTLNKNIMLVGGDNTAPGSARTIYMDDIDISAGPGTHYTVLNPIPHAIYVKHRGSNAIATGIINTSGFKLRCSEPGSSEIQVTDLSSRRVMHIVYVGTSLGLNDPAYSFSKTKTTGDSFLLGSGIEYKCFIIWFDTTYGV